VVVIVMLHMLCLATDSPSRDPHVISNSIHRSQSALGHAAETGHKALVLKVPFLSVLTPFR